MAYVVVQHLASDHESHLAELLSRHCAMPVRTVTETTLVEPNVIYVRPPQIEIVVSGVNLEPVKRAMGGVEALYSIDRFFRSLATERRERSIGIILSGMGTDGSRGVDTIKEYGGLVLVQEPASAQFTGMPTSVIQRDLADLIAPPEQLAKRLTDMVKFEQNFEQDSQLSITVLTRELIQVILKVVGLDFTLYRPNTIRRRIKKRMLITQIKSNRQYLELVRSSPEECQTLAKSFLIGVTRFFRDDDAFDAIREEVIPKLFAEASFDRPVRVWIPACSTGEEAYTLAILLEEYRREHAKDVEFKILASDVDAAAIKTANRGLYGENIAVDVPEQYLSRYFLRKIGGYEVVASLRDRILFAVRDVVYDPPFIRVDLISCRNFLIYVNIEAQARVLSSFHFALNPGGFLMLGPSESLGKLQNAYSVMNRRWKIYTRRPHDSISLPSMTRTTVNGSADRAPEAPRADNVALGYLAPPPRLPDALTTSTDSLVIRDPFAQYLAERYAPISLFVNAGYDIVYINGDVDGLLHFPRHHASFNLKRVLDSEVTTVLCSAVDAVLDNDEDVDNYQEVTVPDVRLEGNTYSVRVQTVNLFEASQNLVAIVMEIVDGGEEDEAGGRVTSSHQLVRRRIQSLEEQLLQSNLKTQKLLSELEATNEELQTSNRELLASNEEMQSTNEELQSVNEELYTVNSEIQLKNEQLKQLNSDINHLLGSTEIGTVFLDNDLNIRRFTPMIRHQFDLHATDVGRPIASFSSSFSELNLSEKCQIVLDSGQKYEEEIKNDIGHDFLLRILSYEGLDQVDSGLVVTFIDIKDLVETRQRLRDMAAKYQALLLHSQDTIVIVDRQGRITEINKWVEDTPPLEKLSDYYISDLIEEDSERVMFDKALRNVFDHRAATQIQLRLRGAPPAGVHLNMAFIPTHGEPASSGGNNPQVMIIIRDISEQIHHLHHTSSIIEKFKGQLSNRNVQGGIIDLDGQIIFLNRSTDPNRSTEEFITANVKDFLSDTGKSKFVEAIGRIIDGSLEERVHYGIEDITLAPNSEEGTVVFYHPLIAGGEIRLISVSSPV